MESGDSGQALKDAQESLFSRIEELKEEFAELLAELRRRKNSDIRLEVSFNRNSAMMARRLKTFRCLIVNYKLQCITID